MCFAGEDDDETIIYVFRRSFITNFDWMLVAVFLLFTPAIVGAIIEYGVQDPSKIVTPELAFVLSSFLYLFTFLYAFLNFVNWFFNIYIITNKRIFDLDFVGFLYKNTSEAPLTSIEDVTSTVSGTLRFLFNYGSVYVQTAAERREFEFHDVSDPAKVRDLISDIVSNLRDVKN